MDGLCDVQDRYKKFSVRFRAMRDLNKAMMAVPWVAVPTGTSTIRASRTTTAPFQVL